MVKNGENVFNPLNATGANMHQVPMLTDNYGSERVNNVFIPYKVSASNVAPILCVHSANDFKVNMIVKIGIF